MPYMYSKSVRSTCQEDEIVIDVWYESCTCLTSLPTAAFRCALLSHVSHGWTGTVRSSTGLKVAHLLDMGPKLELVKADLTTDEGGRLTAQCDRP